VHVTAGRRVPRWTERDQNPPARTQRSHHDAQNRFGVFEMFERVLTDDDIERVGELIIQFGDKADAVRCTFAQREFTGGGEGAQVVVDAEDMCGAGACKRDGLTTRSTTEIGDGRAADQHIEVRKCTPQSVERGIDGRMVDRIGVVAGIRIAR